MEKKLTRRESRETAFLTAFAATFEPEEPTLVPAEDRIGTPRTPSPPSCWPP